MNSEEEIKKRMLQQKLQEQLYLSQQAQMQQRQVEDALKAIMPKILDKKARERLSNLKLVKPEVAMQLELYLAQLFEAGQIKSVITEEQLILMLKKISEKPETKITRK
jgi:programmed cell death protein 5